MSTVSRTIASRTIALADLEKVYDGAKSIYDYPMLAHAATLHRSYWPALDGTTGPVSAVRNAVTKSSDAIAAHC